MSPEWDWWGSRPPYTHSHWHTHTHTHIHTDAHAHNTVLSISNVYRDTNTHTQHQSLYPEAVQCQTPHPELQLCQLYTHTLIYTLSPSEYVCVSHTHWRLCMCVCAHILCKCVYANMSVSCFCVSLCVCINGHKLTRQEKQKASCAPAALSSLLLFHIVFSSFLLSLFHPRHLRFIFFSYKQAEPEMDEWIRGREREREMWLFFFFYSLLFYSFSQDNSVFVFDGFHLAIQIICFSGKKKGESKVKDSKPGILTEAEVGAYRQYVNVMGCGTST